MKSKIVGSGITAALIVLVFLASCQIEMPQAIRVKGSPTFEIPIPMGDGVDNSFIRPYVSVDGIKGQLQGQTGDTSSDAPVLSVYHYNSGGLLDKLDIDAKDITEDVNGNPIQTYLLTYPLFDTQLNLKEYIDGLAPEFSDMDQHVWELNVPPELSAAMNMAYITSGKTGGENLDYKDWLDFSAGGVDKIAVPLGHLKNVISDITFDKEDKVKIVIQFPKNMEQSKKDALKKALRIRAPQIGIGKARDDAASWVEGEWGTWTWEEDGQSYAQLEFKGEDAVYENNPPMLLISEGSDEKKEASENIEIEIKLANKIDTGRYYMKFDFNWYSINIKPQSKDDEGNFSGEFEGFELGSYLNTFAGEGTTVKFKKIPAYFYIDSPGTMNFDVKITDSDGNDPDDVDITIDVDNVVDPDETVKTLIGKEVTHSYDFTDIFNEGRGIKYRIFPPTQVTVTRKGLFPDDDAEQKGAKITANLAVLLPMAFDFSSDNEFVINGGSDGGAYIPINFAGMTDFLEGDNSAMGQIDEPLKDNGSIKSLTLKLKNIQNSVTGDNLYLAIARDPSITDTTDPQDPDKWTLVQLATGKHEDVPISNSEEGNPLSLSQFPKIKFLLKEDSAGDAALFYIKGQDDEDAVAFNINISVVADIGLDTRIDL